MNKVKDVQWFWGSKERLSASCIITYWCSWRTGFGLNQRVDGLSLETGFIMPSSALKQASLDLWALGWCCHLGSLKNRSIWSKILASLKSTLRLSPWVPKLHLWLGQEQQQRKDGVGYNFNPHASFLSLLGAMLFLWFLQIWEMKSRKEEEEGKECFYFILFLFSRSSLWFFLEDCWSVVANKYGLFHRSSLQRCLLGTSTLYLPSAWVMFSPEGAWSPASSRTSWLLFLWLSLPHNMLSWLESFLMTWVKL